MVSCLIYFTLMTRCCHIEDLTNRRDSPGRYYAAAVMKTMLGLFITKNDCQLFGSRELTLVYLALIHIPKAKYNSGPLFPFNGLIWKVGTVSQLVVLYRYTSIQLQYSC